MEHFIGIDLGTTNSVICSYDGNDTRIWKSPEQNDVTPSAIYIGGRGNKFVGQRAYNAAPISPDNCATLFKRFMGTSTSIELSAVNQTFTPEDCSAEVLKTLFGYLPEEIRNDPETGTVITVPAAFNQMQKNATMQAAEMARIGNVALMQEPVAAVMSVMRTRNTDGIFLIYDIGGGTLDIAIAESIGGTVNLLTQGGIQMCGGRDFDRALMDNLVRPWLLENFDLPEDLVVSRDFKPLIGLATWAAERAKIELVAREDTIINLSEMETRMRDLSGDEIYLDIPLQRATFDALISDRIENTIIAARETLSQAGLTPNDVEEMVWVGGPTNYKPLRDKVAFELGIPGDAITVNPMTAVAEGASVFAESVDWSSETRLRKENRGQISSGDALSLTFNYSARTSSPIGKIGIQIKDSVVLGSEFEVNSLDTAWNSGRLPLINNAIVDVSLVKSGKNTFKVLVYDDVGRTIPIEQDEIVITRTDATVDAIPASHTIGLAVLEKSGGPPKLVYLIQKDEPLPKQGTLPKLKAEVSVVAGSSTPSLNFKLWSGEIEEPITDNQPIGELKITGTMFDADYIPIGADLEGSYEILDSGELKLEVSVPCIGDTFDCVYYYGDMKIPEARQIAEEAEKASDRIEDIKEVIEDPKLEQAKQKLTGALTLDPEESDLEKRQEQNQAVLEAKELLYQVRKENLKEIRQIELDEAHTFFDTYIRQHARSREAETFDNLSETAQRAIDNNENDFEDHLDELRGRTFEILWRQDWFVIQRFKYMADSPHLFADKDRFEELVYIGNRLMNHEDVQRIISGMGDLNESTVKSEVVDQLRGIVAQMMSIPRTGTASEYNETREAVTIILAE